MKQKWMNVSYPSSRFDCYNYNKTSQDTFPSTWDPPFSTHFQGLAESLPSLISVRGPSCVEMVDNDG